MQTWGMAGETSFARVSRRLDRQQRSRENRVPTVSVLASPADTDIELGAHIWAEWLAQHGRGGSTTSHPSPDSAVRAWLRTVHNERDLVADILALVLREAAHALPPGSVPAELAAHLRRAGAVERARFTAALDAHGVQPLLLSACRRALGLVPAAPASMDEPSVGDWAEILAQTVAVLPGDALPGITLLGNSQADAGWLSLAAHAADMISACAPEVPVALCASAKLIDTYLRDVMESRAKALVRQGRISINHSALHAPGVPRMAVELAPSIMRLESILGQNPGQGAGTGNAAASTGVLQSFWHAAETRAQALEATGIPGQPEPGRTQTVHQARSAAEKLLFDALQAQPLTAGLFVLNGRLDWHFGSAPIEVDLLCTELGLAVEVDGYYHFRDTHAYRRDRRKDLALQLHDYLVVRCLAEDVVVALGQVLDSIAGAVRARRNRITRELYP